MNEVTIRPMTLDDVEATVRIQSSAFEDLARRNHDDSAAPATETQLERATLRHRHLVTHDPGGAFVATIDEQVVGCGLALRRGSLWGLSLLVVDPVSQSSGAGRKLLNAALTYAAGCTRAVILSSTDPRAIRAYGTSGFDLFPQVRASGRPHVDPRGRHDRDVRDGGSEDAALADDVDRLVRGAARGPEHALIAAVGGTMFVVDDDQGRGYAYSRDGDVSLLAATDDATATALIWRCFEHARDNDQPVSVEHITGEQQWAIEACLTAGLTIAPNGPVFWRGASPPRAYLPSGAFL